MKNKFQKSLILCFSILLCTFITNYSQAQSGWVQQPSGTISPLIKVFATSADTCYVADYTNGLLKTTDGGNSWFFLNTLYGYNVFDVIFTSSITGYVKGILYPERNTYAVLKTTNAGTNWEVQTIPTQIDRMCFVSNSLGWVSSVGNKLYKTTNGGTNWIEKYLPSHQLYSMFFINENTGYASGQPSSSFYTTFNGGENWTQSNAPRHINSLYFINSTTGWSTCSNKIWKTTNSGINWIAQFDNLNNGLSSIYFINSSTGYVVGEPGRIVYTSNAGGSWATQVSGIEARLYSIFFINTLTGWAVGDSGKILKTTNGGHIIGIKPISNTFPINYFLYQNYPNPFNPITNIRFDIPKTSPGSSRQIHKTL